MKQLILIFSTLILLVLPNNMSAQTRIYKELSRRTDLRVAERDNQVVGTHVVTVTLISADNPAVLASLCREFHLAAPSDKQSEHTRGFTLAIRDKRNPRKVIHHKLSWRRTVVVGYSHQENTIFIFSNLHSESDYHDIITLILTKTKNS